jgi:uncharacterized integral membrane protein (TIGR00697 family)
MDNTPNSRYLSIISGLFIASLLITSVTNTKLITAGPFIMTGGTLLFPVAFIFNDILTEVYGFARTRAVIWTGVFCQLFAGTFYWIVGQLPPASFWIHQEAYEVILNTAPRLAIASVIAYLCGEFANSIVLSRMKHKSNGARDFRQSLRFILSTIVGEGVDSIVFIAVAFGGTMPIEELAYTAGSIYVLKVIYEALLTPFSTRFANWLKEKEGMDKIDDPSTTNYNPFAFGDRA